ncbi:MAG: beta-N-acetylglucosaminidase domain-containing protein [Planctomycetes bacterium]|nr:beta-N-acetylglucosaminidase domain-containing protein [Planctomycetota bacterium]
MRARGGGVGLAVGVVLAVWIPTAHAEEAPGTPPAATKPVAETSRAPLSPALLPLPAKADVSGEFLAFPAGARAEIDLADPFATSSAADRLRSALAGCGYSVPSSSGSGGQRTSDAARTPLPAALVVAGRRDETLAGEAYRVEVEARSPAAARVTLAFAGETGLTRAAATLAGLFAPVAGGARVPRAARIEDAPVFAERGVMEATVGAGLSASRRRALLDAMWGAKLNALFLAPGGDPLLTTRWREPYPRAEAEALRDLARYARERAIVPGVGVRPGPDFDLGGERDALALGAKLAQLRESGIRRAVLILTALPAATADPALLARFPRGDNDPANFSVAGAAHGTFAARALAAAPGDVRLYVLPAEPWGGPTPYKRELGMRLPEGVTLFWMGLTPHDPAVREADLRAVAECYRHPVILWENFPGAPAAEGRERRVVLGAARPRRVELARWTPGVVSTIGEPSAAAAVPLATRADSLWNPAAYEPDRSHRVALAGALRPAPATSESARQPGAGGAESGGEERSARAAAALADLLRGPYSPTPEAERLDSLIRRYEQAAADFRANPGSARLDALRQARAADLRAFLSDARGLSGWCESTLADRDLFDDLAPFLGRVARLGRVGLLALELDLNGADPAADRETRAALAKELDHRLRLLAEGSAEPAAALAAGGDSIERFARRALSRAP